MPATTSAPPWPTAWNGTSGCAKQGRHDGPAAVGMRLYEVKWTLHPEAANLDASRFTRTAERGLAVTLLARRRRRVVAVLLHAGRASRSGVLARRLLHPRVSLLRPAGLQRMGHRRARILDAHSALRGAVHSAASRRCHCADSRSPSSWRLLSRPSGCSRARRSPWHSSARCICSACRRTSDRSSTSTRWSCSSSASWHVARRRRVVDRRLAALQARRAHHLGERRVHLADPRHLGDDRGDLLARPAFRSCGTAGCSGSSPITWRSCWSAISTSSRTVSR